jgi:hypothetical protein
MKIFKPRSHPYRRRGWSGVPRIVIVPSPVLQDVRVVGEALEKHLDIIVAIDDDWRDLIASGDDFDLMLKLKMNILDAVSSSCMTSIGNVCPAVVLHHSDIALLWLDDHGNARPLSMKEMLKRRELLYAHSLEFRDDLKLFRLQTYKPLEHNRFFGEQFENLALEFYEMLYGSRDIGRWRGLTGASTLPGMAEAVARAARRFVVELCVSGDYNICPGILLTDRGDRVDVEILKISAKAENYVARIDLAGLLANPKTSPS